MNFQSSTFSFQLFNTPDLAVSDCLLERDLPASYARVYNKNQLVKQRCSTNIFSYSTHILSQSGTVETAFDWDFFVSQCAEKGRKGYFFLSRTCESMKTSYFAFSRTCESIKMPFFYLSRTCESMKKPFFAFSRICESMKKPDLPLSRICEGEKMPFLPFLQYCK